MIPKKKMMSFLFFLLQIGLFFFLSSGCASTAYVISPQDAEIAANTLKKQKTVRVPAYVPKDDRMTTLELDGTSMVHLEFDASEHRNFVKKVSLGELSKLPPTVLMVNYNYTVPKKSFWLWAGITHFVAGYLMSPLTVTDDNYVDLIPVAGPLIHAIQKKNEPIPYNDCSTCYNSPNCFYCVPGSEPVRQTHGFHDAPSPAGYPARKMKRYRALLVKSDP